MTNHLFLPGKITFLLDAPAGSSGKGKLASFVTKHANNVNFLLTSNSPNASHTVIDNYNGKDLNIVFKALPSGSIYHDKLDKVFITSGATFDTASLLKEIEAIGIPRTKVGISPRAGIATDIDAAYERGECDLDGVFYADRKEGTIKTGTTASGSGAVLAKKVLRHKTLKLAKDCPEIADMICIVEDEILDLLEQGKSGLFEIGQGFPLSNNYWRFAPNTTSRNVTVASALNDAFLPPSVVGHVIINTRTFPIRINSKKYLSKEVTLSVEQLERWMFLDDNVHYKEPENSIQALEKLGFKAEFAPPLSVKVLAGKFLTWDEVQSKLFPYEEVDSYSGAWYPDQEEITWEQIEEDAGIEIPQYVKNTTLTKLPRRVATFSSINLDEAIKFNQTPNMVFISVNFINFIDGRVTGKTDINKIPFDVMKTLDGWLQQFVEPIVDKYKNVAMFGYGTSEKTDDYILEEVSKMAESYKA